MRLGADGVVVVVVVFAAVVVDVVFTVFCGGFCY